MKEFTKTQKLVFCALLIALSYIGSMIKIFGSVALDALPAYFGALMFGGPIGAIVGAIGHLFSAFLSGLPMGLPMHILVALCMAGACYAYYWINKKTNLVVASIVAIIINGVVMTFLSGLLAVALGVSPSVMGFVVPMLAPLLIASTVNVVIAALLYLAVSKALNR
ncbi:MAG: ECF transporter S component [Eubacterium sp.]|nr:ECF transporter S component [Eubacterium sp.]